MSKPGYDETEYPRAEEESETDSGGNEDEPIMSATPTTESNEGTQIINNESDSLSNDHTEGDEGHKTDGGGGEIVESMMCGVCFQILLDPITLTCGHSFCQICLAQMWSMSRSSSVLCPMCRQPWAQQGGLLPSVNVIFRSILEHTFPEQIKERRQALSEAEIDIARRYNTHQSQRPIRPQRGVINARFDVICVLLAVFFFAVFISVFMITISLMALGGVSNGYVSKPVYLWSNGDVMEWLKGLGDTVQKDSTYIFEREKIDGRHLVTLSKESLIKYGLQNELSIDSLILSIDQLREDQYISPRTFTEYRTANRKDAVVLFLTYKVFPRLTFGYVFLFHYYDIFLPIVGSQLSYGRREYALVDVNKDDNENSEELKNSDESVDVSTPEPTRNQIIAILIEIILVPHLVVALYAYTGLYSDTILSLLVLLQCIVATLKEVRGLRDRLHTRPLQPQVALKSLFSTAVIYCISYIILLGGGQIICLVLPSVILDLFFYLLLVHVISNVVYYPCIKPLVNRMLRIGVQLVAHLNNM